MSFHLSAPVELLLKSASDGNPVGDGTADVASVRLSICVSICCGNPVGADRLSMLYIAF